MSAALDRLLIGRAYPHKVSGAEAFSTTSVAYAASNAASYSAGQTNGTNLPTGGVRFVEVANDDAAAILYVTLGDANYAPGTAGAGVGLRVYPGSSRIFGFQDQGVNKIIQVLTTVNSSAGAIHWIP